MFDFGLGELVFVGIIALIVLGPERLPEAARTAGRLIGRLQRFVGSVKQEFDTQIELEELRKAKQEFEAAAAQVRDSLKETGTDMEGNLHDISDGLKPWEKLPEQRTPADFGVDENGNPLPDAANTLSDGISDVMPSERSDTSAETLGNDGQIGGTAEPSETDKDRAWREYLTAPSSPAVQTVEVSYIDTAVETPVPHTTSLRKQAISRKRDLRPKSRAKPKLRVRKS
ncbi:TPA: twin-arginine translocase subunit TatB [Neisseria meningitidis]|uniref:Sec-independent protein translocase protein TatB n=1 Tax=Neisseria meningitidis serogroup B (strain ATCC 13091 / M2091) TaxID=862513 RepID=E0NAI9_NEIM3|nr:Sec-independent protein translocase protein TatB [Neisseria meningitidis]EFM03983.1 twin arginine-targeting protein translocase TatB [Neisseria meningitidis ATCC 13091]MCL5864288.1 Sec-independent protein translocase protein TatB [Neisseria meningitidis]MCL5916760.1 Sec-independent protein translocase protein TatB [Neisseria meningitidis]MCL5932458.1 Sec-independent protein translocase protein TatB [Neisseria meningitidis]MCL6138427.1 Sec-independent protein translocase protein TatB [Neisse